MSKEYRYPYEFDESLLPQEFVEYFRSGIPYGQEVEWCCIYLECPEDIDDFVRFAEANNIHTRHGAPWGQILLGYSDVCIYPDGDYASGMNYATNHTEHIIKYQDLFSMVFDNESLNGFFDEYEQGGIL